MTNYNTNQRPKFLNLLQIRLPITAVASILHRITGVLLFLLLPVAIYGLGLSLQGPEGFGQVREVIQSPVSQLIIILVISAVFYHLLAGIRFLLLDIDMGYSLPVAKWSARIVILSSLMVLVAMVMGVFG